MKSVESKLYDMQLRTCSFGIKIHF